MTNACLVTSHYLNRCWLFINWTLGNKFQWNFNQNTTVFMQYKGFVNVICKMAAILTWPHCAWPRYPGTRQQRPWILQWFCYLQDIWPSRRVFVRSSLSVNIPNLVRNPADADIFCSKTGSALVWFLSSPVMFFFFFFFDGWARYQPIRYGITYVPSSLIGWHLTIDWNWILVHNTEKSKCCHDANFVITGGTAGCCANLLCHQWWQSWHHDNSWFPVEHIYWICNSYEGLVDRLGPKRQVIDIFHKSFPYFRNFHSKQMHQWCSVNATSTG